MRKLLLLLCFAPLLFACEEEKETTQRGSIVFGNDLVSKSTLKGGSLNFDSVTHAVITIVNVSGDTVVKSEKVELYKVSGQILSYPLELNVGNYELTDFYLVDANNNAKYLAPKEGSEMAAYVLDPLNISFTISANDETKITVEVLSTEEATPIEFGYAEFDATIVNTFDIFVAAFVYNDTSNIFELASGSLNVEALNFAINQNIQAKNNLVKLKDGLDSYTISFIYEGDTVYGNTFSNAEIKAFEINNMKPLKIYIKKKQILVLQPGEEGNDVFLHGLSSRVDINHGSNPQLAAFSWTFQGEPGTVRSLIDFDLSAVPSGIELLSAKLSLYAWTRDDGFEQHSTLNGSNASIIQKVTNTWHEDSVTWSSQPTTTAENQVLINKDLTAGDDLLDVDITELIKDKLSGNNYYGMMLKLQTEQYYRCLNFCSSDFADSVKRPKLVLEYYLN